MKKWMIVMAALVALVNSAIAQDKTSRLITSLYVIGNSYSATTQATAHNAWPGQLSASLNINPFVQANNAAQPSATLWTTTIPLARPGLVDQLQRLRAGSKEKALLVVWIFPPLDTEINPVAFSIYTLGIDLAYAKGFRTVLMPNLPDITKTAFYKSRYSPAQLVVFRNRFAQFNAQYKAMIEGFKRRHPDMKVGSVDVFNGWDGSGTVPDGLHPNTETHKMFAKWFEAECQNLVDSP
jgi:lysophospholipase L1-like esterase